MNSEKVKEIKEKLKKQYYYLDQAYSDHLAYGGKGDDKQEEEIYFLRDVLTLINEFESENERLKEQNGALSCDLDYINEKLANAEIEVDDYKDQIAELEKENETKTDTITDLLKKQEFYEKEKLKQFAERLFEKYSYDKLTHEDDEDIEIHLTASELDETLKEFEL